MKYVTGKMSWRSVLSVKVPGVDKEGNSTTKECTTQHDIFDTAEPVLLDSFSGAFS